METVFSRIDNIKQDVKKKIHSIHNLFIKKKENIELSIILTALGRQFTFLY